MLRSWTNPLLGAALAALLVISVASPAFAYGKANWELTFHATGTLPGVGGTGFWGWCDLAGGNATDTSGTSGDCQIEQYVHGALGPTDFNCHENVDLSSWSVGGDGNFLISGKLNITTGGLSTAQQNACIALFPGSNPFSGVDSGIPAAPGHYNFGGLGPGLKGPFSIQVNQIP
jgi:hypothetical protein